MNIVDVNKRKLLKLEGLNMKKGISFTVLTSILITGCVSIGNVYKDTAKLQYPIKPSPQDPHLIKKYLTNKGYQCYASKTQLIDNVSPKHDSGYWCYGADSRIFGSDVVYTKDGFTTVAQLNEFIRKSDNYNVYYSPAKSPHIKSKAAVYVPVSAVKPQPSYTTELSIDDDISLKIHFGNNNICVIQSKDNNPMFSSQILAEYEGALAFNNHLIKVDGKTMPIQYSSSNVKIAKVNKFGSFEITGYGEFSIKVTVNGNSSEIPFKVLEVPVIKGADEEQVIKVLGIPDKVNKKHVLWLDGDYVDGIFYYASDDDFYGVSVHHWLYDNYPNVIFRMGFTGIKDCTYSEWEEIQQTKYKLERSLKL